MSYSGQGQLYVCTSTNTWTLYYTPFVYPHPLIINVPSAATPVISPSSGSVPQTVTITDATTAAIICYNTTGYIAINGAASCPGGSTQYTTTISVSSAETLYAWAGGTGLVDSGTASGTYTSGGTENIPPVR